MKTDNYFENLRDEFIEEYCSTHGGNFTREKLAAGFTAGFNNCKCPDNIGYHGFLAWQAGKRHGGHALFGG